MTRVALNVLRHDLLQEGDVLVDELFLQADGVRGDDDLAFLAGGGGEDGGDEVGEGLADAGAGLDHEVVALGDGVGDGVGHVELLRPRLVARELPGDDAGGAEDGFDGHDQVPPVEARKTPLAFIVPGEGRGGIGRQRQGMNWI